MHEEDTKHWYIPICALKAIKAAFLYEDVCSLTNFSSRFPERYLIRWPLAVWLVHTARDWDWGWYRKLDWNYIGNNGSWSLTLSRTSVNISVRIHWSCFRSLHQFRFRSRTVWTYHKVWNRTMDMLKLGPIYFWKLTWRGFRSVLKILVSLNDPRTLCHLGQTSFGDYSV